MMADAQPPTSENSDLLAQISQAEIRLQASLQELEQPTIQRVDVQSEVVRAGLKETIENPPTQVSVEQRIENMQLRLELLRNIRMNWGIFQESLEKKGMNMRINQDAHLRHLIAFLETGKGVEIDYDTTDSRAINDPARALMTFEVQPTGAGKTGAFAIDIALMNVPSLTLVPFDPLLDQTKSDFEKIGGIETASIGFIGGGEKDIGKMHTIATYAGHAALLKSDAAYRKWVKEECKLVICDEVHYQALGDRMQESLHAIDEDEDIIENEREALATLSESTATKSLKIGFTATPRASRKHVSQYFPHCLGRLFYKEMIEAGLVVPYRIVHCDGSVSEGEFDNYLSQAEEAQILSREGIYRKLTKEYAEVLATYRKTKDIHAEKVAPIRGMAFCTNHAECVKFAEEARSYGLRCKIVTGKEARGRAGRVVIDKAIEELNGGEIDLIVTVEKLATGFNRPEINAIVWARITSAAKTIQGIGRGGRSHVYPGGIVKSDCLVFETNWSLKGNMKKGSRPLRFADALAQNGEDPMAICSMADGSALDVNPTYSLDEDGIVEIGGKLAISIYPYAAAKEYSGKTLGEWITDAGLLPVPGVRVQNKHIPVDVYWKDEVDPLLPKRLNEQGIVDIGGRKAVGITAYANAGKLVTSLALLTWITEAGLQKIPNVRVMSYRHHVDVYWKDEVDNFIPKKLDENGIVPIDGRLAVGLYAYAKAQDPPMAPKTLVNYVEEAKLQPVPNVEVLNNRTRVDVYWKDQVDPLIPKQIPETGIININGRDAVGIGMYLRSRKAKVSAKIFVGYLQDDDVRPLQQSNVYNGAQKIDLYWKDQVDAVLPERVNDQGIVELDGREAVSVGFYAKAQEPKLTAASLQDHIDRAGLQSVQNRKVLCGNRQVIVYWKDEVDMLLPKRLNEQGIVNINGREAISIYSYARSGGANMSDITLNKYVKLANLQPVPNVWVISGKSSEVDVYWKDQVDAVLREQFDV